MKKLIALFALLLAALALVACGSSDSSTNGGTSPAAGAVEEAEDKAEEVGEEAEEKAEEIGKEAEDKAEEAQGGSAGSATSLDVEADPSGALAFTTDEATAKAGKVTVNFTNSSPVPHNVYIEDESGEDVAETETISESSESTTANLKPGTYTFYCDVPGHRQGGMEGTLTVK
jgi:plastocyanin